MNTEQMIAWLVLEGWEPVHYDVDAIDGVHTWGLRKNNYIMYRYRDIPNIFGYGNVEAFAPCSWGEIAPHIEALFQYLQQVPR